MSASAAKRRRADTRRNLAEHVRQAHDRLHKDDIDEAHQQLHAALGLDDAPTDVAPMGQRSGFDAEFRKLCLRHAVRATFVMIDTVDEHGQARLLSGGDAELCALIDRNMRRTS